MTNCGETNLKTLLSSLTTSVSDDTYVFATITSDVPETANPIMVFKEAEGISLILKQSDADKLKIPYEFPCKMITLNVHSSLDAVGFIAHIATQLASNDMGVNPVSGFYHDHLFIAESRVKQALNILKKIAKDASKPT